MIYAVGFVAAVVMVFVLSLRQVTIFEFERGLMYQRGRFARVLEAGSYWILPRFSTITRIDIRPIYVAVPSQELSTSDGATVKITVAAKYQVSDPDVAVNQVSGYQGAVYTLLQLALREIVAGETVESLMSSRPAMGQRLLDATAPKVSALGVTLMEAEIKDIMLPADLKRAFAQVLKAKQEGLAALERARGEAASLRHLANAAGLLEQRPALLQLRMLQAISQTSGNSIVLGVGSSVVPLPINASKPAASAPPPSDTDG